MFHEAGHIVLHGHNLFLEGAGGMDEARELEANRFAADLLIPPKHVPTLAAIDKSTTAVETFAKTIGIAPGIVVGRMQREGLLPWTHLNGLKVTYSWIVDDSR